MNKNSLLYRLITTITTILAILLVIFSIILTFRIKSIFYEDKIKLLDKQSKIISDAVVSNLSSSKITNKEELHNTLNFVNKISDVDALVTDNVGFVFAGSGDGNDNSNLTKIALTNDIIEKLKSNQAVDYAQITYLGTQKEAYLKPVFKDGNFCAVVVMFTNTENIESSLSSAYRLIWISTLIVVVLSAVAINYFTKKKLINPLKEINIVANKLAKGEVDKRIEINSKDEIGELAKSFNIMAQSLEAVDTNRKKFISNVSHELRSPITSIKGFISGMIDGVIPKDKEDYYLNLVYDEINRLSRLVNELLDMSSMEVGKFKLSIVEVDINELIKKCLLNIGSKIEEKGVKVSANLEKDHLFVYADSDRIMQVITNLLDNAIKYGGAGGIVIVSTKVRGTKVYISVYNNGPTLSEEEINHIWERFYKSDKARTNKDSTGLGLPISRLILTQHKQDIWVQNENDGVVFTFTLSRV
jgi:signal transduction histidine kinase